ncbi:MAG: helix-turn-helix domain-containing protein, partial [Syntrophomonadaceae bacterium]|nr:helix-turn-helix domain-containing protein [Syntrophomonadaceae bacterium]
MEERKEKRQLILEAAARVFSQRGYHQAKVEEIAAAAGVGKGTVYEYFDSKLELFQQMCSAALG